MTWSRTTNDSTIELLPMLNNKQLQKLINALVIESKKKKKNKTNKCHYLNLTAKQKLQQHHLKQ